MYKKSLFIVFEGIEGSGKSYQAKILYKKLQKFTNKVILTREPGGTKSAEIIRNIILKDYFEKNKGRYSVYRFMSGRDPFTQNTWQNKFDKRVGGEDKAFEAIFD